MANVLWAASANSTPASGTLVATHTISSAEHQVMHIGDAAGSILGTSSSPLHAAVTNVVTVAQGASSASPWPFRPMDTGGQQYGVGVASPLYVQHSDGVDAAAVNAASRLMTEASIIGGSVALLAGANVIGTASVIQTGAWSVAASVVNSPSVFVTSAVASPVFTRLSDGTDTAVVTAASELLVNAIQGGTWNIGTVTTVTSVTSVASLLSGSVIVNSAVASPVFSSITNLAGSAVGSPFFVAEVRSAGSAAGSPLFTRISDGTDTALVDAASRLGVAITDGTNVYGLAGSPLPVIAQANQVYWAGSLLTIQSVNLSASISGCTPIVASLAGFATIIVSATFTTSACQRIGWTACGNNGGASAVVQTPMPFGTNGGMDANRLPHGHLWTFPSGSIAVLTTTSACYVAGTLDYLQVAS
jgi:hypothetical protein